MSRPIGDNPTVGIIGAGMAGPLASILMARRGYAVTLFEQRSIKNLNRVAKGRSFNLTLTERGLAAFRKVGLEHEVKVITQPLSNRVTHFSAKNPIATPYGDQPGDKLYSVQRSELNQLLLNAACAEPNVTFRDATEFVDYKSGQLILKDIIRDEIYSESVDFILGADGVNSRVREMLHRGRQADLKREYFDWAYKEFSITRDEAKNMGLSVDSLHVWPSPNALLIAIPNRDGSMTGDLLLPRRGEVSLDAIRTTEEWNDWMKLRYGKLSRSVTGLAGNILASQRTGYLQILSTSVWTDSAGVLLMGDSAHGVFPFYGQGMNSALEDCLILDSLLDQTNDNVAEAFTRFERERKVDTDALCELSLQHFYELQGQRKRKPGLSSLFRRGSKVYSLVAHTTRPYREALQAWKRQEKWFRVLDWATIPAFALIIALVSHHSWAKPQLRADNPAHAIEINHGR